MFLMARDHATVEVLFCPYELTLSVAENGKCGIG